MTRGRHLIRGSGVRVLQTVTGIVATFLITPYILSSLGNIYPDSDAYYGLWKLVGSFMGYYGMLDLGISSAIGRFLSRAIGQQRPQDEKEIVGTGLAIYSVISLAVLLVTGVVLLLTPLIIGDPRMHGLFRILALLGGINVALSLPFRVFSGILTARLRFDLISGSSTLIFILRYLAIYLSLRSGYGLIAMGVINLLATFAESAAFFGFARPYRIFDWGRIQFKTARLRELFSYSSITFVSSIAEILRCQVDSLVIAVALKSTALVTPYSFPFQLIQYGSSILSAVIGTFGPVFSQEEGRGDYRSVREKFLIATKICNVGATLLFAGLAIHGSDFIRRWIGRDYAETTPVLLWLTAAFYVAAVQMPSVHLLYAVSKHKYYAAINIVEGVLNLVVSLILVRPFGIVGVAMGTALPSFLLRIFFLPVYTCRAIALPVRDYLAASLRTLTPLIAYNALFYLGIRGLLAPRYGIIIGLATVQTALYLPLAWWLVFTPGERAYLFGFLRRRRSGSGDAQ